MRVLMFGIALSVGVAVAIVSCAGSQTPQGNVVIVKADALADSSEPITSHDASTDSSAAASLDASRAQSDGSLDGASARADESDASLNLDFLSALPGISEDGKWIALRGALPGYGDTFASLEIIEVATDRTVKEIVLADPRDTEHPIPASRADEARAELAKHTYSPLVRYEIVEDTQGPTRQGGVSGPFKEKRAEGEGLHVLYREPTFMIDDERGMPVVRRAMPKWSYPAGERCKGCGVCPAPLAGIESVHALREKKMMLVVLWFRGGSDVCKEPPPIAHVVHW